ncbi:hypothetical protein CRV00_09845 [Malaciobacter molluscorum]|uniref:hypothetical protein n=1 Tax=Malaciobacter molluscorum TaxID=1032072 RepID=UPI00100A8079|nr:hypothetical protein [Malaciobacter molluscorum]RXJ93754.1 hypothetical protein CRV00_09845 [Malaciobacter molluscorum]
MIIDTSIDTTINNMDVATYFKLEELHNTKSKLATNYHKNKTELFINEEYIKLQFEEMKLLKEEYELF